MIFSYKYVFLSHILNDKDFLISCPFSVRKGYTWCLNVEGKIKISPTFGETENCGLVNKPSFGDVFPTKVIAPSVFLFFLGGRYSGILR